MDSLYLEEKTKAAIGELARGAAAVYLLGTLPRGLHHEWLGRYERRNASSLVNGRFVYANAGFEKKMLWFAGGAWYVGVQALAGESAEFELSASLYMPQAGGGDACTRYTAACAADSSRVV